MFGAWWTSADLSFLGSIQSAYLLRQIVSNAGNTYCFILFGSKHLGICYLGGETAKARSEFCSFQITVDRESVLYIATMRTDWKRRWFIMVLLALCLGSRTVEGSAPVFKSGRCETIITQPDTEENEATVYWAFPLATNSDGSKPAAVTCDSAPGAKYGGDTLVTCTATDLDTKATAQCSFQVRVYPTFETGCPADFASDNGALKVDFAKPVANRDIDGGEPPSVSCNPDVFPVDTSTPVKCEATGDGSRKVSCTFTVTRGSVPTFDNEGSCSVDTIVTQPDNGKNTASSSISWTEPTTATPGATVKCDPDPDNYEFVGGDTTVTCKVTDGSNPALFSECSFDVRVYPTFKTGCPADIALANGGKVTFDKPVANNDINDGEAPQVTCMPVVFQDDKMTVVTCTATGDGSREVSCTFKVALGTLPTFDSRGSCDAGVVDVTPDEGKMTVTGISGKWGKPTSTDSVTCDPDPDIATFSGSETVVTCKAVNADLFDTCTFTVRVYPAFDGNTCGKDITLSPDPDEYRATHAWITTANKKDGEPAEVTCDPVFDGFLKFEGGENVVTCQAKQTDKEVSTCEFKVSVWPNMDKNTVVGPIVTAPDQGSSKAIVGWSAPTARGLGTNPVPVECIPPPSSSFNGGVTPVDCSAIDPIATFRAVNRFTVSVWPNLLDGTAVKDIKRGPKQGTNTAASVDWVVPTAYGSNAEDLTVVCKPASGSAFSEVQTHVKCEATDPILTDQKTTDNFKVLIYPTFDRSCPDDIIHPPGDGDATVVSYVEPTGAIDSGQIEKAVVTCVPRSDFAFPNNQETDVTCFATDSDSGTFPSKATCSFKVTVGEVPKFPVGCPEDIERGPTPGQNKAVGVTWAIPTATQSDGQPATVTCNKASGSDFSGSTEVTCTAVDSRMPSLKSTCTFHVHVYPMIIEDDCKDKVASPSAGSTIVNYVKPSGAIDSKGTHAEVTCDPDTGTLFTDNKVTRVTCTATDPDSDKRDVATCTFKILVAAAPTFDEPHDCQVDVNASPDNGKTAIVSWTERTAKQGDGTAAATVTCNPASGSVFKGGDTPVTCTAVDPRSSLLSKTCDFKVRIYPTFESGCTDISIEKGSSGSDTVVDYALPVGASDSTGKSPAHVSCNPTRKTAFNNDAATGVTCTARDSDRVKFPDATCTFKVKVGSAPTFKTNCPSMRVVAPNDAGKAVVTWNDITGNEDSSGQPAVVQCDHQSGDTFDQPDTLVTCTATDAGSTRTSQCSFRVLLDSIPPPILCPDDPLPVQAGSDTNKAKVTWVDPIVSHDDGDPRRPLKVRCVPLSGSEFEYGSTDVYCSAIDPANNVGECSFKVTVTGNPCDPKCTGFSNCQLDTSGNPKCVCQEGYSSEKGDGSDCADIDECAAEKSPCHANADCTNQEPGYQCACKDGFFGDGIFTCNSNPTEYPDIDAEVEKKFVVEISIADATAVSAGCDPSTNGGKLSEACIALVNTFKQLMMPLYRDLSSSFKEVIVVQTQIRPGSVVIPHTVSYDYAKATPEIRGLQTDKFYADTLKKVVEEGRIGPLQLLKDYIVKDTTDFCTDDIKNKMKCNNSLSVYEDKQTNGCVLYCASRCDFEKNYCNTGTCQHDNSKGPVCSCPEGTEGDQCTKVGSNIPLIVGLSVGLGGGALLIIVCLLIYLVCCKNKNTKITGVEPGDEEVGRSNEALAMNAK